MGFGFVQSAKTIDDPAARAVIVRHAKRTLDTIIVLSKIAELPEHERGVINLMVTQLKGSIDSLGTI